MDDLLTASIDDTVRILRPPPKVYTDELGRNIWMSGVAYKDSGGFHTFKDATVELDATSVLSIISAKRNG